MLLRMDMKSEWLTGFSETELKYFHLCCWLKQTDKDKIKKYTYIHYEKKQGCISQNVQNVCYVVLKVY